MTSTIVRRLLAVVPTVVVATVVVFALVQITPGGAAEAAAGPTATPQQVHAIALEMGLDKPVPVQYANWLWNLAHGDLGQSLINRQSVSQEIGQRLPVTLELTLRALLVALLVGIPLGILSAARRQSRLDAAVRGASGLVLAVPAWLLGRLPVDLFALYTGL